MKSHHFAKFETEKKLKEYPCNSNEQNNLADFDLKNGGWRKITFGDLHGNALLFTHLLIRAGVIEIDKEWYEEFHKIYNNKKPEELKNEHALAVQNERKEALKSLKESFAVDPAAQDDYRKRAARFKEKCFKEFDLTENDLTDKDKNYIKLEVLEGLFLDKKTNGPFVNLLKKYKFNSMLLYCQNIEKLTQKWNIIKFKEMLNKIEINKPSKVKVLTLLGDELADRGNNDYFTPKILEKLNEKKDLTVEILLSNHSLDFLIDYNGKREYKPPNIIKTQAKSLVNLGKLMSTKIIQEDEITRVVDNFYKPKLKLISYTYYKTENHLTIYSHAPITLKIIQQLATHFNIKRKIMKVTDLMKIIDEINTYFRKNFDEIIKAANDPENIVFKMVWRRRREGYLSSDEERKHIEDTLKEKPTLTFVHGHTGEAGTQAQDGITFINLNSYLGHPEGRNEGSYLIGPATEIVLAKALYNSVKSKATANQQNLVSHNIKNPNEVTDDNQNENSGAINIKVMIKEVDKLTNKQLEEFVYQFNYLLTSEDNSPGASANLSKQEQNNHQLRHGISLVFNYIINRSKFSGEYFSFFRMGKSKTKKYHYCKLLLKALLEPSVKHYQDLIDNQETIQIHRLTDLNNFKNYHSLSYCVSKLLPSLQEGVKLLNSANKKNEITTGINNISLIYERVERNSLIPLM